MRTIEGTGNPEADEANFLACLHLLHGNINPRFLRELVALLRSDLPLDPALRQRIADGIDGTSGTVKIEISRKKRGPKARHPSGFAFLDRFGGAMQSAQIGAFLQAKVDQGQKVESAVQEAMDQFSIERSEAFAALSLRRAWSADVQAMKQQSLDRPSSADGKSSD